LSVLTPAQPGDPSSTNILGTGPGNLLLVSLAIQGMPAWIGLPLAILIILSPIGCLVLFVLSLGSTRSLTFRRRCAVVVFVLPLVALAFYAIYEAGVPPEVNIRVDLLLIYPVLAIDFLFWPALLARYFIDRRD
jgi:hypothetical protein